MAFVRENGAANDLISFKKKAKIFNKKLMGYYLTEKIITAFSNAFGANFCDTLACKTSS